MKRTFIFAACLLAMSASNATYCPSGTVHAGQPEPWYPNRCNEGATPTPKPAEPASNTLTGEQRQQQAQLQGQAQRQQAEASARAASISAGGAATSNASGGRSSATAAGAGAGAGAGSGIVTIQGAQTGSGDSYTDRSVSVGWAPIIPAPAAPALATANMVVVPGVCGPRHDFIRRDVQGRKFNSVQADESFAVGTNDTLIPSDVPFIERNGYLMGSLITEIHAVPGTSAAGGFSVGAFSKGDGVQGGLNGSSSVQQLTTRYTIKDCVYALPRPVATTSAIQAPRPVALRRPARKVVAKAPPDLCLESAAASCRVKSASALVLGK